MVIKVASTDKFQFKVVPTIKNICMFKQGDVHYIGVQMFCRRLLRGRKRQKLF